MCEVRFGGAEAEYLLLVVQGRSCATTSDWLDCEVEVMAGAFRGRLRACLRTDELSQFQQELATLYERLTGQATLENMDQWIHVCISGDGRGHMEARCLLQDNPGFGNTLDCRLHFDQTALPGILRQLAMALKEYPVVQ